MIPEAAITHWQSVVPWAQSVQVEQDLIISRAVVEMFSDPQVASAFAFRGGTALHKLYLTNPERYSEDIDLVQHAPGPTGQHLDAIRRRLDPILGEPQRKFKRRSVILRYRAESEIPPVATISLKIEINTQERFSVFDPATRLLRVDSPWFTGEAQIPTYSFEELLGTKLRALYQRKKGRDLFDLWLCLDRGLVDPERIITSFLKYMEHGGVPLTRAQFEANLAEKSRSAVFHEDLMPLLPPGLNYDGARAFELVQRELVARLPGEPWKGP